ncbi:hypothetical protein AU902_12020 [Salmonella enterica subsp. enterica serovar Remo]|nr:hypothetical protein [Salmonella enterica subsp. enterica serovar Remo]
MADIFQPKGEKQGNAKKRSFDELALAYSYDLYFFSSTKFIMDDEVLYINFTLCKDILCLLIKYKRSNSICSCRSCGNSNFTIGVNSTIKPLFNSSFM